jgi:uncharacterized protein YjlB
MSDTSLYFVDDGDIPNHPRWPVIVYSAVFDAKTLDQSATAFDDLFAQNRWTVGFRNGIYPFVHYHSNAHEALGVARGSATVKFGGQAGRALHIQAGDALLLPAGTGHQLLEGSADLLVIGAYPPGEERDLMRQGEGHKDLIRSRIASVPKPSTDPIHGHAGQMVSLWK